MKPSKRTKRISRHRRVRSRISGMADMPRVSVFRSNRYVYAQVIDDVARVTVLSVSDAPSKEKTPALKGNKTERATALGERLAAAMKEKKMSKAVFDRGGYKYHGRVKAIAEGLRKGGIQM